MARIEQERRDFKAANPALYGYIGLIEGAKVLDSLGDEVSGRPDVTSPEAAANFIWSRGSMLSRGAADLRASDDR